MKEYLIEFSEMESDGFGINHLVERVQATSKVEALMFVINKFGTAVHSVSSVERIK